MSRIANEIRRRFAGHGARVVMLMALAALLLGWLYAHTEIVFADGLRYIEQARRLEAGDWASGIKHAVDHPLYPLTIATAHRVLGMSAGPLGWQAAAQAASVLAGVLLVVPLYLVARELFGGSSAWLACLLSFLVPVTGHVLADGLSEGWFLLLWTLGFWTALRYLRAGAVAWLATSVVLGGLSYLCRPEGLLLPVAVSGALGLCAIIPSARMPRRTWWTGILLLTAGAAALVGPYVVLKGGIGTKPAVARLLGLAPPSDPGAVERERPLDPRQTKLVTYGIAARETGAAIRDVVPLPLLALATIGLPFAWIRSSNRRGFLLLGLVLIGWPLALVRLHATGGYCSPRHTLIVALPLLAAAAAGFRTLAAVMVMIGKRVADREPPMGVIRLAPWVLVAMLALAERKALLAPVNAGAAGYRQAGLWLAEHASADEHVADVTGWSQFYGARAGYVFANLIEAPADPALRWVIVRDAHLQGPWPYCERLRGLVVGAKLVVRFPPTASAGRSRVSIYERPRRAPEQQAESRTDRERR